MPRLFAAAALALVVIAAPLLAHAAEPAMKPAARAHLDAGLAAYAEKDWTRAIREFRAGYAIDARPEFLFAWAQAARLSGDCRSAIDLYDRFVATGPAEEQAEAATQMAARCRESVAAEPPAASEPAAEPASEPPPRADTTAPAPAAPVDRSGVWWKDGWGGSFAAAGLAGVGVGVGFYLAAGSSEDAAERAASYDEFALAKDEAASRRTIAIVAASAGGAFLVASAVRYVVVHRRTETRGSVAVSFAPTTGGAALWLAGSF